MKKSIIIIVLCICVLAKMSDAQNVRVLYEERINQSINFEFDGIDDPAIVEMLKSQLSAPTTATVLNCQKEESLYEPYSDENQEDFSGGQQGGIQIHILQIDELNKIYKNRRDKSSVAQRNILDRSFLISEPLADFGWTFSPEEKTVAGYLCKKAVANDETTAWYAPEIALNDGPDAFWGVPGLILEVETGDKTITATSVEIQPENAAPVKAPSKGKKISREAFDKLKKEREEEMTPSSEDTEVKINIIRQ